MNFDNSLLLDIVVPLCGNLTSSLIYISPFKSIQSIEPTSHLNPLPFAGFVVNSLGWLLYGLLQRDGWLLFSSLLGFPLSLYYCIVCISVFGANRLLNIALIGGCLMVFISASIAFLLSDRLPHVATILMGSVANVAVVMLYSFPLSTMKQVIKSKNSESIHFGIALTSAANGLFWLVYGLALADPFIYVSFCVGILLAGLQMLLKLLYRQKLEEKV